MNAAVSRMVTTAVAVLLVPAVLAGQSRVQPDPRPQRGLIFDATHPVEGGFIQREPISFVENKGQYSGPARFRTGSGPLMVWLEPQAFAMELYRVMDGRREGIGARMSFEGASASVQLSGRRPQPGVLHYSIGNDRSKWRTNVKSFAAVDYEGLYPGIDLRVRDNRGNFEYDLYLEPHASLGQFVVRCEGIDRLSLGHDGSLILENSFANLFQLTPVAWQTLADGTKKAVKIGHRLLGSQRFGFTVEGADPDLPLVIDPVLTWTTYIGGSADDRSVAVRRMPNGNVTIAGETLSMTDFPTKGRFTKSAGGSSDAFISQFDPTLSGNAQLVWSAYFGGGGQEQALDLTIGSNGWIWLVGWSNSTNLPVTPNAYQRTNKGTNDAFIVRFHPLGVTFDYMSYFGGKASDWAGEVHVDKTNRIVTILGYTESSDLPVMSAFQSRLTPAAPPATVARDAFVTRFDVGKTPASQVVWSTYLGGNQLDGFFSKTGPWNSELMALHVDAKGVVTMGVQTDGSFPTTAGTIMPVFPGTPGLDSTIAITRLDPTKTPAKQLVWSTYMGGGTNGGWEWPKAIEIDGKGDIHVAGTSYDPKFPTTAGSFQPKPNPKNPMAPNSHDGVFFKMNSAASKLLYGTFLGASSIGSHTDMYLESSGAVVMSGYSFGAVQQPMPGARYGSRPPDAVLFRLFPAGNGVRDRLFLSEIGGPAGEACWDLAPAPLGKTVMTGVALSPNHWGNSKSFQKTKDPNSRDSWAAIVEALPSGIGKGATGGATGIPSPSCAGDVFMGATAWPRRGSTFSLTCTNAPPIRPGLLLLNAGPNTTGTSIAGLTIYPSLPGLVLLPAASGPTGFAANPTSVPPVIPPGTQFAFQYFWLGPTSCPQLTSNALDVTIQ